MFVDRPRPPLLSYPPVPAAVARHANLFLEIRYGNGMMGRPMTDADDGRRMDGRK